jgi:hemerythrin
MKMVNIQWSDSLELGVSSIDDQHKELVRLLNELGAALQANQAQEVLMDIFNDLVAHTISHFGHEELAFAQYGYPCAQAHVQEHEDLKCQIIETKQKLVSGSKQFSDSLLFFLRDWLNKHILESDKKAAEFLAEHGMA